MNAFTARVRTLSTWQVTLFASLAALGFLVAAQVRSEGPRVRYTTQERAPLVETVLALQAQQETLKDELTDLQTKITDAETTTTGSDLLSRQLSDALLATRVSAGLVALEGPGLVLQLDDSQVPVPPGGSASDYLVTAADIRTVVEELWLVGAEAVSVNGERITASTAIVDIGDSILVNSAYLAPPYQVAAVGSPDLYQQLVASAGFVELVQARADRFGIRFSFAQPSAVVVPAYAGAVTLHYARQPAATPVPVP